MMIKDAGRNVRYALDFRLQDQKSSSYAASTRHENGRVIDIGTGYEQKSTWIAYLFFIVFCLEFAYQAQDDHLMVVGTYPPDRADQHKMIKLLEVNL